MLCVVLSLCLWIEVGSSVAVNPTDVPERTAVPLLSGSAKFEVDLEDVVDDVATCYNQTESTSWQCRDYDNKGVVRDDPMLQSHHLHVFREMLARLKWQTAVVMSDYDTGQWSSSNMSQHPSLPNSNNTSVLTRPSRCPDLNTIRTSYGMNWIDVCDDDDPDPRHCSRRPTGCHPPFGFCSGQEVSDKIVDRISQVLVDANCLYIHYVIQPGTSDVTIENWINETYHDRPHTGLNYVIVANDVNTDRIMRLAGEYDTKDAGKTALFFFSKWLFVTGPWGVELLLGNTGDLDHVAVIAIQDTEGQNPENQTRPTDCFQHSLGLLNGYCNSNGVDILTVYHKSEEKRFCCVGFWNNQTLEVTGDIFPNTKFGFNNRTLRVGTNIWPPFVYQRETNDSEEFYGYTMELLREVAKTLNFSYTLHVPEDKEWGAYRDGRWTGLVGDLYYGNVDLVAAPITQTTFREEGCDFTYPYFYDSNVIIIKMPDPQSTKWRALLDIFSWQVLAVVFASLPLTAAIVLLVEKVKTQPLSNRALPDYSSAAWYLFGALLNEGGILRPWSLSGRTVVGFWWLYCLVLTATFTGQLMSSLTVTSVRPPFDNLMSMLKQDGFRWGTVGGGTSLSFSLEKSHDRVYQNVWQGILKFYSQDERVLDPDFNVHYQMVQDGSYAYLTDTSSVLPLLSADCSLKLLKEEFFRMPYAFALPEGSPFVDTFSERMFLVLESGLLKIWEKHWWPRNNCTDLPRTQALSLGMLDVQSAYYVLFVGITIGAMALGFESIKTIFDKRRLQNRSSFIVRDVPRHSSDTSANSLELSYVSNGSTSGLQDTTKHAMVYRNLEGQILNIRQIKHSD